MTRKSPWPLARTDRSCCPLLDDAQPSDQSERFLVGGACQTLLAGPAGPFGTAGAPVAPVGPPVTMPPLSGPLANVPFAGYLIYDGETCRRAYPRRRRR